MGYEFVLSIKQILYKYFFYLEISFSPCLLASIQLKTVVQRLAERSIKTEKTKEKEEEEEEGGEGEGGGEGGGEKRGEGARRFIERKCKQRGSSSDSPATLSNSSVGSGRGYV